MSERLQVATEKPKRVEGALKDRMDLVALRNSPRKLKATKAKWLFNQLGFSSEVDRFFPTDQLGLVAALRANLVDDYAAGCGRDYLLEVNMCPLKDFRQSVNTGYLLSEIALVQSMDQAEFQAFINKDYQKTGVVFQAQVMELNYRIGIGKFEVSGIGGLFGKVNFERSREVSAMEKRIFEALTMAEAPVL